MTANNQITNFIDDSDAAMTPYAELLARVALLEQRAPVRRALSRRAKVVTTVLGVIVALGTAQFVFADPPAPASIPYRGVLDEDGIPAQYPSGIDMTFALYDSSTGSTRVGFPYAISVPIIDGKFSVAIPVQAADLRRSEVWLSVEVGGVPLAGRQRLLTVPYALRATESVNATGNGVPVGAVMYFDLAACPVGWQQHQNAKGRYLVGANTDYGWGIGAAVGTALTSDVVRSHTHTTASHSHTMPAMPVSAAMVTNHAWQPADAIRTWWGAGYPDQTPQTHKFTIGAWSDPTIRSDHYHIVPAPNGTTVTVNAVQAPDIAPFLTLLACVKL